jgi:hypothetical protein
VLRLTASTQANSSIDIQKVKYPLLELIPCNVVDVELGPPVVITVPGHGLSELAPGVLRRLEDLVGCSLVAEELPD